MNAIIKKLGKRKILFLFTSLVMFFTLNYLTVGSINDMITHTLLVFVLLSIYLVYLLLSSNLKDSSILNQINGLLYLYLFVYNKNDMLSKGGILKVGGWAMSPDLLTYMADLIRKKEKIQILEMSSGTSSIVIGMILKERGYGKVTSLENDIKIAEDNKNLVLEYGLEEFVNIVYAPLVDYRINNQAYTWYSLSELQDLSCFDLVIVDGPYGKNIQMARYPAIPLLYQLLSPNCHVLLDDTHRSDEQKMIKLWTSDFNLKLIENLEFEKGACLLQKKK
jgi:hypothetical protein